MIHEERIHHLNDLDAGRGDMVLYWMQASQRTLHNHALEYAIRRGNEACVPVVVFFGIKEDYPEANERHFRFMIEGLAETASGLSSRGIRLVVRKEEPVEGVLKLSSEAAS
ncbi:MAG: deoxyribodipyrimidine photo-lyase, partial [Thermoplasmatota archaeon]